MFEFETILTFVTASVLLALAPGPDNIFVLTQSVTEGRKAGFIVTAGLCTGLLFHTAAVAFGVAVIFNTSVVAFNMLKMLGVAYLLYLAWKSFKAGSVKLDSSKTSGRTSYVKLFRKGIILNITNPKVSIFFLAFLPQFTTPGNGNVSLQMLVLGGVFIMATIPVFSGVSLLGGICADFFNRSQSAGKVLNRIGGTVFTGLAVKLLLMEK